MFTEKLKSEIKNLINVFSVVAFIIFAVACKDPSVPAADGLKIMISNSFASNAKTLCYDGSLTDGNRDINAYRVIAEDSSGAIIDSGWSSSDEFIIEEAITGTYSFTVQGGVGNSTLASVYAVAENAYENVIVNEEAISTGLSFVLDSIASGNPGDITLRLHTPYRWGSPDETIYLTVTGGLKDSEGNPASSNLHVSGNYPIYEDEDGDAYAEVLLDNIIIPSGTAVAEITITDSAGTSLDYAGSYVVYPGLPASVDAYFVDDTFPEGNVIGVMWDYGDPDPELYRLYTSKKEADAASATVGRAIDDPNDLVTVNIQTEPVASKNGSTGSSPFDEYDPWRSMLLVAMSDGGAIHDTIDWAGGETISSFVSSNNSTSYDFMVRLPESWYTVIDDPVNERRYYYISDTENEGLYRHPASETYIARYQSILSGSELYSRNGVSPTATMTYLQAHDYCENRGTGYGMMDWLSWSYIQLLYLIEYADFNSQNIIEGGVASDTVITSGNSNSMIFHTGYIGENSLPQYRFIEGIHSAYMHSWIDGLMLYDGIYYVSTDRNHYDDNDYSTPNSYYVAVGKPLTYTGSDVSLLATAFAYSEMDDKAGNPFLWSIGLAIESENNISFDTYSTDGTCTPSDGTYIGYVMGCTAPLDGLFGIFRLRIDLLISESFANVAGRLMYYGNAS